MDEQLLKNKKRIGLALSGGFVRAAAHIGVIEALQENNIKIDFISGSSSGAVVAACYAAGKLGDLKEFTLGAKLNDFLNLNIFLEKTIGNIDIKDLNIKLFLALSDLLSKKIVVPQEGRLIDYLLASIVLPGFKRAKVVGDKILVDGGVFANVPTEILYQAGADYVIASDVSQNPNFLTRFLGKIKKNSWRDPINFRRLNYFEEIIRAIDIATTEMNKKEFRKYKTNAIIKPELQHISRWQIGKIKECIEEGRKATMFIKRTIEQQNIKTIN